MQMLKLRGIAFRMIILYVMLAQSACLLAQQAPFQDEITAFKKQDSMMEVPKGAILFVGSSSFRIWKDMQADFPGYKIINRGFGGSTIPDVTRYAGDIILPYQPKQIVIYCGDNDLAAADTVTAQVVYDRFVQLYQTIRSGMKKVPILFVSIKPSPSRAQLMPRMEKANQLIKDFLLTQKNTAFVDVYHLMLDSDGKPIDSLFLGDKLHMNRKGYAIWQKAILPYLIK